MATLLRTTAARVILGLGSILAAADAPAQTADPSPEVAGCAGAIERWQDLAKRENDGDHMDTSVYEQIQGEIDRASRLCQAGQDAPSRRLVTQSMRRHGY